MSDLVRLRYTGTQATTFQHPGVGHLEPGGEFDAPAESLLSFMRRPDIEHVAECHQPPCKCGEEPEPVPHGPEGGTSGKPKGKRGALPSTQDAQA